MRKLLLFSLVLLLIFAYATAALALPADYGPIEVLLFNGNGYTKTSVYPAYLSCDGQAVEMDVPGILYDNRTLVPIRFVGELLGAKIDWDQQKMCIRDRPMVFYQCAPLPKQWQMRM